MRKLFRNLFKSQRDFTKQEAKDLREMNRLYLLENFKLQQMTMNVQLFKNGPTLVKSQEVLVSLLLNAKQKAMGQKLTELGYANNQPVSVNLETGKITIENPKKQEVKEHSVLEKEAQKIGKQKITLKSKKK